MPTQPLPHTILLIEDEPAHARLVGRAFHRAGAAAGPDRWAVEVVTDGPAAVARLAQGGVTGIILDYSLPGQTGLELLPELQAVADVPVLMLTGQGDEQIAVAALKAGADDYVVKSPDNYRSLPHRIVHVLEERQGKERLAALHRLSAVVSQSLDLDQVLDEVARSMLKLLGNRAAMLLIADERDDCLRGAAVALAGSPRDWEGRGAISNLERRVGTQMREITISLDNTESPPVSVFLSQAPRYGLELSQLQPSDPIARKVLLALRQILQLEAVSIVPLLARAAAVGVMLLDTPPQERLTDLDRQVIETYASQAAVAIKNARLFAATRRQLEELTVLHAVATAGAGATSENALVEQATRVIGEMLYPDNIGVLRLDEAAGVLRDHYSYRGGKRVAPITTLLGQGITGRVAADGRPRRVPDVTREPGYLEIDPQTRSELCVPLKVDEQVIGVINVESNRLDAFTEADEQLLVTLAGQLATAIAKMRLFAEVRQRAMELSTMLEASRAVSSTLDLEEVLVLIAEQIVKATGVSGCALSRWDQEADAVVTWIDWRQRESGYAEEPGGTYALDDFPATRAVLERRQPIVIHATDPDADPAETALLRKMETVSLLMLPLATRDQVIGLVELDDESERDFSSAEIRLCRALVSQVAIAIENARLYGQTLEASRLKTEFLAIASHELRTPISAVTGYLQLVLDGLYDSPDEQRQYLNNALASSLQLLALVNDILDVATIEAGEMTLNLRPVALRETLDEVKTLTRPQAEQKGLQLTFADVPGDLQVEADPGRLKQVLLNLVNNAIKFTPRGRVQVRLAPGAGERKNGRSWVRVEVCDTGIGLTPRQHALLFQKFGQADSSSTRRFGGTGLGLAICKNLVTLMGGKIDLESDGPGRGSRAWFTLPLIAD